jgi:hypothetical protein
VVPHLRFRSVWLLALSATLVWGQQFRSSISGVVTDQSGASVASAKVTAVQTETGTRYDSRSTSDGRYSLLQLLAGTYRIEVEAPGFKKFVREGITVSADQQVGVDISLQLGTVNETLSVTENASMLNTENASQGQVVNMHDVENLPLNGRTPMMLTQLSPGIALTTNITSTTAFQNGQAADWAMGGAAADQNELMLDGNDNTQPEVGQLAYSPPQDAVQQVIVQTDDVDSALGHTGGGAVNVITRSGANQFHGSVYEFNEVSALGANAWLNDAASKPKPVTRQNQYGFTVGGPVILPKVFNGRNKLFYFFAFEGIQDSVPEPYNLTVPTAPEKTGDFSALLALGHNYQIYNPYTAVQTGSTITRQPFAGNLIPSSMISPIASKIVSYYPAPNEPGLPDGADNYETGIQTNTFNNELGRIDYNIGNNNKLYWNIRHNFKDEYDLAWFNNPATGRTDDRINWGSTLDDVYTITPTLILDTRFNWTRFITQDFYGNGTSFNFATQLNLPASLLGVSQHVAFPAIGMSNYTSLGPNGGSGPTSEGFFTPQGIFEILPTVAKVTGAHTIKFGADLRQYQLGADGFGYSSGYYEFGSSSLANPWTNGPTTNAAPSPIGQDLAALLLGLPAGGEFDQESEGAYRQDYMAFFVQDDWRVRRNLTLNLGLRYDQDFPTTERYNRNVNGFEYASANPIQSAAQAAYAQHPIPEIPVGQFATPGGLTFASPSHPDIYHLDSHLFSPRVGFAWTPNGAEGKTTIRGGFAMFEFPQNITTSVMNQTGYSIISPITPTQNNYLSPYATLANPFPAGLQPPQALNATTALGASVASDNPHLLNGYSVRWDFDVQRQFGSNFMVEVGYEGNHGVHLGENQNVNYTPINYLSTAPTRNQAAINLLNTSVANPFKGLFPNSTVGLNTASKTTVGQLVLPYPEYTGVTEDIVNDAGSYYEMGFIQAKKRFSHGLQFQGSYTHSRLMANSRLNPQTPLVFEPSSQDFANRVVASVSYELPFGTGKTFGSNAGPILDRIIGGWVVNSISTYQSGAPLAWGNVIYLGGPLDLNPSNPQQAFNTAVFDRNPNDALADNLRTFPARFSNLRAYSYENEDFSALKNVRITERASLQLRFEFFNLFNHPVFAAPNLTPTSSAFGTITGGTTNQARQIQLGAHIRW